MEKIAHVKQLNDGTWAKPQSLCRHMIGTAMLSSVFAKKFNSGKWGYINGLLHDIGKSSDDWQFYIRQKSGFEKDLPKSRPFLKVEHSIFAAIEAEKLLGKNIGRILSYSLAGHHAGLPDWLPTDTNGQSALIHRIQNPQKVTHLINLDQNIKKRCQLSPPWSFNRDLDISLWIRMLFSCLVDADFLDTERYMNKGKFSLRGKYSSISELAAKFDEFIGNKFEKRNSPVNLVREKIYQDCIKASSNTQGIFTLTAPTGGGKTLSSMAFALKHALKHNCDRIIYVIPFTSIIEQTADVFKKIFGEDQIVEHHSNVINESEDDSNLQQKLKLATENWDAPIVITTSVQFFESLFSARTSRCRKLHNIAKSVVIIDETQLLPVNFLSPILKTIELLARHYYTTFVLSTATQPYLSSRENFVGLMKKPQEIISNVNEIFSSMERYKFSLHSSWPNKLPLSQLAKELCTHESVLCIVSDRRTCRDLFKLMPKGTIHLSALMCGAHRSQTIKRIKESLEKGDSIRVISTQLVEAGVDIDFPVVYRSIAGLDSIAQAGGRCNREGKLALGKLILFKSEKLPPVGVLRKASEAAIEFLDSDLNILNPSVYEKYFLNYYTSLNDQNQPNIQKLLLPNGNELTLQFRTASQEFKIIDNADQTSILVPFGEGKSLIELLKNKGPEKRLLRKLQRYSINIYNKDFDLLKRRGSIEPVVYNEDGPCTYAIQNDLIYNDEVGLLVDDYTYETESFIL